MQDDVIITDVVVFSDTNVSGAGVYAENSVFVSGAKLWFSPDGSSAELVSSS